MKKLSIAIALAGMLGATATQAALQVTLLQDTTGVGTAYSSGNGGEFRAVANAELSAFVNYGAYASTTKGTISGGTLNGLSFFQTFCIEYNEHFSPGTTYNVNGISPNAMYGSMPPNGDPISKGTAWLYSNFAAGVLTGYDYNYGTATRSPDAGDLQKAIWYLEGESGGVNNYYVTAAINGLYADGNGVQTEANALLAANGLYGVYALNVGSPGSVQDQLVIGTPVPEASTIVAGLLLLLPFGASTIRILRKNRAA